MKKQDHVPELLLNTESWCLCCAFFTMTFKEIPTFMTAETNIKMANSNRTKHFEVSYLLLNSSHYLDFKLFGEGTSPMLCPLYGAMHTDAAIQITIIFPCSFIMPLEEMDKFIFQSTHFRKGRVTRCYFTSLHLNRLFL